jgi:hypothetical protein
MPRNPKLETRNSKQQLPPALTTDTGTEMSESWQSKLLRWRLNLFRAYRNSGARVTFIDRTFQIVRIRLPLTGATRNLHHSIFGGSMYSAVDPVHATMLMFHCGQEFAAWT